MTENSHLIAGHLFNLNNTNQVAINASPFMFKDNQQPH